MNYIILDIEFNGRKFASELPMEVIEIGAVRLDEDLNQTGTFSSLIKPVYFSKLNSFIRGKTGIAQAEIDRAPGFPAVMRQFLQWLGPAGSFLLVTWGGEDVKRIVLDTRMHKMDEAYWLSTPYYDLLKGYLRVRGLTNDVSVERALEDLGLPPTGAAHRALDDAIMTSGIFRALHHQLDLDQVRHYKDTYSNAKERRTVRNAIRTLTARKTVPEWSIVVEHFLKDKVDLSDARKEAELRAYFDEEKDKK